VQAESTILALFRRGVAEDIARSIAEQGYTFGKLQQMGIDTLQALGLDPLAARRILDAERPPVSFDVVARLMHECRRICCVCRQPDKSLVLHHTREWGNSHSHDEEFLVVICANCHGEAHTKRELGRNLTPEQLLKDRELWAARVAELEAQALFDADSNRNALGMTPLWDYFNHRRIVRAAAELGIDANTVPSFARIAGRAPVDELGAIDWSVVRSASQSPYMYDGDIRNADGVYSYFAELLTLVVAKSKWIDLDNIWTPTKLRAVALPGRLAVLTAGFRFKSAATMSRVGPGQEREGHYKRGRIRLHFTFDGWETTSTSSRGMLSGIWRCTAVCVIRSVVTERSLTSVEATCLGIGTGFGPYPSIPSIAYRDEICGGEPPDDDERVADESVTSPELRSVRVL
jgi:hypothetical protein